jgi:hypothetical protein
VKRYLVKATASIHGAVSRDEGLRARLLGALPAEILGGSA